MRTILIVLCCLPALITSLSGEVLINEVLFDPEGADTELEWVELINSGDSAIDLRDYLLDVDGPNFMLPDYILPSGDILVVHTNFQGTPYVEDGHMYLYNPDHNMGNSHGFVGLWRPNDFGQVADFFVSYVEYGAPNQTWESQAITAEIWYDDEFVPDVAAGHSIHWDGAGYGAAFWYDDDAPIPGPAEATTELLLISFVAGVTGENIQLHWSSGFTGSHFVIQRSTTPNAPLREVVTVPSYSATGSPQVYSWIDGDITPGEIYTYRLSGVDHDGETIFQSETVTVTTTGPGSLNLLPNFPNPFNSGTRLRFQLAQRAEVNLTVFNTMGQMVISPLQKEMLAPGQHTVDLDLSGLPGGTYFCRVATAGECRVQAISYLK